jgi:hypothetical protein
MMYRQWTEQAWSRVTCHPQEATRFHGLVWTIRLVDHAGMLFPTGFVRRL